MFSKKFQIHHDDLNSDNSFSGTFCFSYNAIYHHHFFYKFYLGIMIIIIIYFFFLCKKRCVEDKLKADYKSKKLCAIRKLIIII